MVSHSNGGNCEEDESEGALDTLRNFIMNEDTRISAEEVILPDISPYSRVPDVLQDNIDHYIADSASFYTNIAQTSVHSESAAHTVTTSFPTTSTQVVSASSVTPTTPITRLNCKTQKLDTVCSSCGSHVAGLIINQISLLRQEVKSLTKAIGELKNTTANNHSLPDDFPVKLPISNKDDISILEDYLKVKVNEEHLASFLAMLGGETLTSKINTILRNLVSDTVAQLYNFAGQKKQGQEKAAFKTLTLSCVVFRK
ncbi:hypothetical protein MML48_10g00005566 [Holotrichia oblita]|uniref:Uncharacterized protein n=1 Tax=Holotrichia oblita TaxID=644536 RepID=A0ACB9SKB5_HOLOL|nr:hypothetical protein MML48_10g00005566 [Holotrichia oblita]